MKRSTMVQTMVKIYASKEAQSKTSVYDLMDLILQGQETVGISPPTITVLKDSYNRSEGRMGFDSNEWEPEDD